MSDDFQESVLDLPDAPPRQKASRGGRREKLVIDEITSRQIATSLAMGATFTEIGAKLGISRDSVRNIAARPFVKEIIREIGEYSVSMAKAQIRRETSQMVDKIMRVINQKLDDGDLDAVKIGLKILGLNDEPAIQKQDTNLTVVLPGAEAQSNNKPIIEVPHVKEDESGSGQFDPKL